MKSIEELTGLYSLSKTLCFELKPIGKTLEQIERKGLLTQDLPLTILLHKEPVFDKMQTQSGEY